MGMNKVPLMLAWKHLRLEWREEDMHGPDQVAHSVRLMQGDREIPAAGDQAVCSLLSEDAGGRLPDRAELQLLEMAFPKWPKSIMLALHGITVLGAESIADAKTCAQHVLRESPDCLLARQLASMLAAKSDLRCPFGVDSKSAPDVVGILTTELRATNADDTKGADSCASTASSDCASDESRVPAAKKMSVCEQMSIRFRCSCGTILKAAHGSAGKLGKCPRCGQTRMVPIVSSDKVRAADSSLSRPKDINRQVNAGSPAQAPPTLPGLAQVRNRRVMVLSLTALGGLAESLQEWGRGQHSTENGIQETLARGIAIEWNMSIRDIIDQLITPVFDAYQRCAQALAIDRAYETHCAQANDVENVAALIDATSWLAVGCQRTFQGIFAKGPTRQQSAAFVLYQNYDWLYNGSYNHTPLFLRRRAYMVIEALTDQARLDYPNIVRSDYDFLKFIRGCFSASEIVRLMSNAYDSLVPRSPQLPRTAIELVGDTKKQYPSPD